MLLAGRPSEKDRWLCQIHHSSDDLQGPASVKSVTIRQQRLRKCAWAMKRASSRQFPLHPPMSLTVPPQPYDVYPGGLTGREDGLVLRGNSANSGCRGHCQRMIESASYVERRTYSSPQHRIGPYRAVPFHPLSQDRGGNVSCPTQDQCAWGWLAPVRRRSLDRRSCRLQGRERQRGLARKGGP